MKINIKKYYNIGLLSLLLIVQACAMKEERAPIELTWKIDVQTIDSTVKLNSFTIKNISRTNVDSSWCIYYSQLPKDIGQTLSKQVKIEVINANYYRIYPTSHFKTLKPGDSLVVSYKVTSATPNISQVPEGAYWVKKTKYGEESPCPVKLNISQPELPAETLNRHARLLYYSNMTLIKVPFLSSTDILPSIKKIHLSEVDGYLELIDKVALKYDKKLYNEANLLQEKLGYRYHIDVNEEAAYTISLKLSSDTSLTVCPEKYIMQIHQDGITIISSNTHGIFNGTQTLLALLNQPHKPMKLAYQTIIDYPDLEYRGFMLDVARNFTQIDDVKKIIDVLASYKINKLHLHLTDDEGWRLEIPGLEELTAVGGRRGHTHDETECLYPCYDGNFNPTAPSSGNGYYTCQDFIELLKFAKQRHVQIIPEIEAPGHARAAIVAMEARYKQYIKTDPAKAEEFLLSEKEDSSKYKSAQSYTDNVINVSLPSTYKFTTKVISEIQKMYQKAGLTLTNIHLGGDEVPTGAWKGSPQCDKIMQKYHFSKQHDLFEYFYTHMAESTKQLGIKISGWQEIGLHNTTTTDNKLMSCIDAVYCWNTVPEWGGDIIPYTIANKGFDVILCNVNNFYMDLMYSANFNERGLSWAGTVNEAKSFSALPFSIYRSSRTDIADDSINIDSVGIGKVMLNAEASRNIKGVQGQLFSETIRTFDDVTTYIFPKILGLIERGWNAHPRWEYLRGEKEKQAYYQDLSLFYEKINRKEMPYLKQIGFAFHIPNPGLMIKHGKLLANSPISGATIRYTTDGTEPIETSLLWTHPISCAAPTIKARLFYLDQKSTITTIKNL